MTAMGIKLAHGTRVPLVAVTQGMRLQAARKDAGLSQDRMAQLLGCSRRTVTRWEADELVPPAVVMAYSMATDVNLAWLETGKAYFGDGEYTPRDLNPEPTDSGTVLQFPMLLNLDDEAVAA